MEVALQSGEPWSTTVPIEEVGTFINVRFLRSSLPTGHCFNVRATCTGRSAFDAGISGGDIIRDGMPMTHSYVRYGPSLEGDTELLVEIDPTQSFDLEIEIGGE